jgi:hypothetical protein
VDNGDAELERMIAKLRALPDLVREVVPDVADVVREELTRTIAQATTPEGHTWNPTREGRKALATAAQHLRVTSLPPRVFVVLTGHVARHSLGRARGGVQRRVLPRGKVPAAMAARIRKVLGEAFRTHMVGP